MVAGINTKRLVDTGVIYVYCIGMKNISATASIEFFHLLLLAFLGKKLAKTSYALKGGCNLRFFFASPRYSEDMDIDVQNVSVHSLQTIVGSILQSTPFRQALLVQGVEIEHVTEHKQSDTTQRWKLGLQVSGYERPVPTKVEFSRRGFSGDTLLEGVNPALVQKYGLPPVMTPHYIAEAALLQKINALAGRSITQARDIFDLHLLQSRERLQRVLPQVDAASLEAARHNALTLTFDHFKGQVLSYLQPEDQALYDSPDAWESIQLRVLEMLEVSL